MPYTKKQLEELIAELATKHSGGNPETERLLLLYGGATILGDRVAAVQLMREIPCDVIGEDQ